MEIALAGSGLLFIPYDKWTIPRSILVIGGIVEECVIPAGGAGKNSGK